MRIFPVFCYRLLVCLPAALLISEFGSGLTLFERLHTPEFYVEYGATLFITIVVMETVHHGHNWLERKFPWSLHKFKRLSSQFLLTGFLPAFLVYVLASVYFLAVGLSIHETDYLYFAYPFILLAIAVLNMVYIMLPFFLTGIQGGPDQAETNKEEKYIKEIMVYQKGSMVKLPVEEIRCIYIIENVVLARTDQSGDFVVGMALDQLKSILDPQFFFRINRQLIASRAACKSYSDAGHGKLSVTLEPAPNVITVVSQLKAKAFRSWITAIKRRDL